MRITGLLCGLSLFVAFVAASPLPSKDAKTEDLSPLNEVFLVEMEDDNAAADDDRTDRDKRKIGAIKLGVSNGIINFVFGKLDALIDAKTKALSHLDEANKIKNVAYGIDPHHSATQKFLGDLVAAKIHASSGSIGPVISGATSFLANAKAGIAGAFASKLAPLSSLSSGLLTGVVAKTDDHGISAPSGGGSGTGHILGNLLNSKISSLAALSHSKVGVSGSGESVHEPTYGNISGGNAIATTTEDIPEFDRTRVSLEVPGPAFGNGFNLITSVSKILNSVILNSARRTQTVLEIFKPIFRGVFAIKGLPSDNPH